MEKIYIAWCVRCKKKVDIAKPELTEMKGKHGSRKAVKGFCLECETKVYAILKKDGTQNKN